ncbi:hypothetical protein ACFQ73_01845 [Amycolatopsis japonica]|uniref:hypothetical protein n=1 Tax=Amycolatopsis japonica TaxID=208439 RepID=UPI003672C2FD
MSAAGRSAALPPQRWRPPARRVGLRVEFVSEDGRHRKEFDFTTLPGNLRVLEEFATAFETMTGPLGTTKRVESARNLWAAVVKAAAWLHTYRPEISSLAELGALDARALAAVLVTPAGDQRLAAMRTLVGFSPLVRPEFRTELARLRFPRSSTARQPYTAREAQRIAVVARGILRQARERIRRGWEIVHAYRAGGFDELDVLDPRRSLAEVLDHCARTGDVPRSPISGGYAPVSKRTGEGRGLAAMLHVTAGEIWAFAVLLTAETGFNASMLAELPAPAFRATAPGESAIALLRLSKPRRGSRSEMTLPLDTIPRAFHSPPGDARPMQVRQTSLSSALGVFALLIELTTPARELLGTDLALAYYGGQAGAGGSRLRAGMPQAFRSHRSRWVRAWLSGDPVEDELLLGISLDRIRKTHLERNRRPVAHTPGTLARYLSRMDRVTVDGFQIVREALDDEVAKALHRRKMTVIANTAEAEHAARGTDDTVLGACTDFEHSPEDGQRCRRNFLHCLDCSNARAFPQHLPMQLLVLDELHARRDTTSRVRQVTELAGRIAQLSAIVEEYEPAQREQARAAITDDHRHLVGRLFTGDLDTP